MATVLDLLKAAARNIGVLAGGEDFPAQEATDALAEFNRMVDQWAAQRLQIYTVTRTVWTITSGNGSYLVGPAQTINAARPVFVEHIKFQDTAPTLTTEYPLAALTDDQYARITLKTLTNTLPANYYYNPTYPYGTVKLWPVPTSSTLQGVLYGATAVAQFTALTDAVALPPGYQEMIVKNVAVRLAPSYQRQVDQNLYAQAQDAVSVVKRANYRPSDLSFDPAALIGNRGGTYSIITDGYL